MIGRRLVGMRTVNAAEAARSGPGHARRIAALAPAMALLAVLVACGGDSAPTAPSTPPPPPTPPSILPDPTTTPLQWSDERYFLQIIGGDMTDIPSQPPCSPPSVPAGGKTINTFVWFTWEGDELVGRSRPPYGATIEIRMRRLSSSILGVAITGTLTGGTPDEYDYILGRRDSVFNTYEPLKMEGVVPPRSAIDPRGPVLGGLLTGHSAFNDRQGTTSFCTNVRYYLEPSAPGGVHDDPSVPPIAPGLRAFARPR
jgi:hypothetical protein